MVLGYKSILAYNYVKPPCASFFGLETNICHKLFLLIFYPPQEIDAITTQPSSDQQSSLPSTDSLKPQGNNKSASSEEQKQQSTEFEYNTQYSLATGKSNGFGFFKST